MLQAGANFHNKDLVQALSSSNHRHKLTQVDHRLLQACTAVVKILHRTADTESLHKPACAEEEYKTAQLICVLEFHESSNVFRKQDIVSRRFATSYNNVAHNSNTVKVWDMCTLQ